MQKKRQQGADGLIWRGFATAMVLCAGLQQVCSAQTCTTQARMTEQQRAEIGGAAYALAAAVAGGDTAKVRAGSVSQYAGDPGQTAYLVQTTGTAISGDQLAVTQAYLLDASERAAPPNGATEFACTLSGTQSETEFTIGALPRGRFAFVMVEARGAQPWLLPFLLEQEGGAWKMAGFYPHARSAGGHDGLWFWTTARADAKANKPWLAWVLYGEADQLLRPATFVNSGNLDRLLSEQRDSAPQPLSSGLNATTPLTVQGPGGAVYRFTGLGVQGATDGTALRLVMHLSQDGTAAPADAASERSLAGAKALLLAHPELKDGFSEVTVAADGTGGASFVVQRRISDLMAASAGK